MNKGTESLVEHEHDHSHAGHRHDVKVAKVERPKSTVVKMLVEIPGESVKSHEQSMVVQYQKQAKIPGFRPGKAPLQMIRSKFQDDIRREVISHLLESALLEALEQQKLMPVNRPKIQMKEIVFDGSKPFSFEAEFEVQPEIELKKYKGIPFKKEKVEVTEEEIAKTVEGLRERFSSLEPLEAKSPEKGNFAVVDVAYQITGEPTKSSTEKKNYTVELGVGQLLPELDAALLAMKVGENRSVVAKFPDDYYDKAVAGKEATYDCTLLELKKKVLPELNDAFASQLREGTTLETVRKEIREDMERTKAEEAKKAERKALLDYLIQHNTFDVPETLIQNQMQRLMEWMQEDMKKRRMPAMEFKENDMESLRKRAEELVRGSLLLKEVATKEKLEVNEAIVEERIQMVSTQLNKTPEDARKWLSGNGMMDRIKDDVLTDQVYDFLTTNAEVKQK